MPASLVADLARRSASLQRAKPATAALELGQKLKSEPALAVPAELSSSPRNLKKKLSKLWPVQGSLSATRSKEFLPVYVILRKESKQPFLMASASGCKVLDGLL